MNSSSMADSLSPSDPNALGETRYAEKVKVTCGDKDGERCTVICTVHMHVYRLRHKSAVELAGFFIGGHWDRNHKQRSDVWILCSCGCQQRLLCREFEAHAGERCATCMCYHRAKARHFDACQP